MEIHANRIKIDTYETGIVITIKEKNWTKIIEYATPCFVMYKERLIELHNDFLVDHSTLNHNVFSGEDFKRLLPQLLEFGDMLEKPKE